VTAGVLLLAHGGPDSPDDIPAYLVEVRGGRPAPPGLVEEIAGRYRQIGGCSPLGEITRSAAARLGEALRMPVYVGMRHWQPTIREEVGRMVADGLQHCIAVCMAPHAGALSSGAYRARLAEAVDECSSADWKLTTTFVESWHTQPEYLDGIAASVRTTLSRFPSDGRDRVMVIFTGHSLPASVLDPADPYPRQLRETASLVAERLGTAGTRWVLCYQSARQDGRQWLEPQIEALVPELASAGERNLLVAPVGFVTDNLEVLYDLDIGVQGIARRAGVRLERAPMLNDSPALVSALAEVVRNHLTV
jgi:ferrochelatase